MSQLPFRPPVVGLKREMLAGTPKFGMFLGSSSVQLAEVSGFAGIDYLIVDLEHGEFGDARSAAEIIRAADATGTPVIVRPHENSVGTIAHLLDHGAAGICMPHVSNRAEAEAVVANAKYAPDGVRAMTHLVRAAGYTLEGWNEYWRTANEETIVMVIIEDRSGLENIEEIAAVPGIDAIWVGTGDLSQDAGVPGEMKHPTMIAAVQKGIETAQRHGKISFTPLAAPPEGQEQEVRDAVASGFQMLAWLDTIAFAAAVEQMLGSARSATAKSPSAG